MKENKENKRKVRRLRLKYEILIPAFLIIILVCGLMGYNSYSRIKNNLILQGQRQAITAARVVNSNVDSDKLGYIENSESSGYKVLKYAMRRQTEVCDVLSCFTVKEKDGEYVYGIDATLSETTHDVGDAFDKPTDGLKQAFEGEEYASKTIQKNAENQKILYAYIPVENRAGKIIAVLGVEYDASEIAGVIDETPIRVITICAFCMVVGFALFGVILSKISKNVRFVENKIYDLVHNEGDLTQKLNIHSGDELEMIAEDINALLEYIRLIMESISENSLRLNASSQLVADNLAGAENHITDVSATMEEMSASMEETTASLNQIDEAVEAAVEAIEIIADSAKEGKAQTEVIADNALAVKEEAIATQENALEQAQTMAQLVNEKIEQSKAVREIEALTANIIEITEQTNLLSLNASIEAARAGDAGRGFAVVADEIGKLASNSAEAAAKIKKVSTEVILSVNDLAQVAENMLTFMENTAMEGYSRLLDTSESYQTDASNISGVMEKFSANSEVLQNNMRQIRESIAAVNAAMEESAKGVTNVTEMSVNITSNVSDIGVQANGNLDIAANLSSEVSKFKLV